MNKIEIDQLKLDRVKMEVPKGMPIVMLNLLRYKDRADYGNDSETNLSGQEAYFRRYVPSFLRVVEDQKIEGVNPLWIGNVLSSITDPENILWDNVALMEYRSFEDFCTIVESNIYKEIAEAHRFAALADTKLIVLVKAAFNLPK